MTTNHDLTLSAFVAPDGSIGISQEVPEGSFELACGHSDELHQAVRETALLGRDGKTWFMPGARQAPTMRTARNALRSYFIKLNHRLDAIIAEAKLKAPWRR